MKSIFYTLTGAIKHILFILLIINGANSFAQVEKTVNAQIGLASVHSGNLNKLFLSFKEDNPHLKISDAHSSMGISFGIGGGILYPLSSRFSLLGELNFSYQTSKIFINTMSENLDVNFTGTRNRTSSDASLRIGSLNVPILVKFKITPNKNYFLLGGFTGNFSTNPSLKSHEEYISTTYTGGVLTSSTTVEVDQKAGLTKFNAANVFLTLGVERRMKRDLRNLSISFRGNFPLTGSPMYAKKNSIYDSSLNNGIFTAQGKAEAESFSGIKLNDFRMGSYHITFTYHLVGYVKPLKSAE